MIDDRRGIPAPLEDAPLAVAMAGAAASFLVAVAALAAAVVAYVALA